MLAEKQLHFSYLPYGDVCKRSTEAPSLLKFDDEAEYEEFEAELEEAIKEEKQSFSLIKSWGEENDIFSLPGVLK